MLLPLIQKALPLEYSSEKEFSSINSDIPRRRNYSYNIASRHLLECGNLIKVEIHCKQCEAEHQEQTIIDKRIIRQTCGLRYCNHLHCQITRYARIFESLRAIQRLKGLRKLWHFVIGFEPIDIIYFKEKRKEFDKLIASYFKQINKQLQKFGIAKTQAFKFLDFAREQDNKYFMHYHFLAIPFKLQHQRIIMKIFQEQRKALLKKALFHIQFFGNKSKLNLFSYMAKRCAGLYKPTEKPQNYIKGSIGKLKQQIGNNEFMRLSDFLDFQDYFNLFYKKRLYATIGGLPYGSILVDSESGSMGFKCPLHGILQRNQVKMRFIAPPPPNLQNPTLQVTTERIDSFICKSCGVEFSEKDGWIYHRGIHNPISVLIQDSKKELCPYCYYKGTAEYRFEQKQILFEAFLNRKI